MATPSFSCLGQSLESINKHVKGSWTLLIIWKIQIKTAMKHHFMPIRMIIIKKQKISDEDVEKLQLYCEWEHKIVQLLWKMVWWFLKKLNTELLYNPAISLWGIYSTEARAKTWKGICTPSFTAVLSIIGGLHPSGVNQRRNDWINVVETHNGV